ncbi:unnamed protein product [Ectocarpus sp. 4 AP-2014]
MTGTCGSGGGAENPGFVASFVRHVGRVQFVRALQRWEGSRVHDRVVSLRVIPLDTVVVLERPDKGFLVSVAGGYWGVVQVVVQGSVQGVPDVVLPRIWEIS